MELSKELQDFLATHNTKVAERRSARGKSPIGATVAATSFDELMAAFNSGKIDPSKIGFTIAGSNSATPPPAAPKEEQSGGSSDSPVSNSIQGDLSQSNFNQAFETALAENGLSFAINAITGNAIGMLGKAVSIAADTYSAYTAMEAFSNQSLAEAVTTQAQENAQHEAAVAALNESIGNFGVFGYGNPNANQSTQSSSSGGGGGDGGLTSSQGLGDAGLSAVEGFGGFGIGVGEGFGGGLSDGFGGGFGSDGFGSDGFGGDSVGGDSGGDAGGGDGGGKIVCTAMNQHYGFGNYRNKIWLKYAQRLTPAHEAGYHYLFLPLVTAAYKESHWYSNKLRLALEHIARRRTIDIKAELRKSKRSLYNRLLRLTLEPLCYVVGSIVLKSRNRK